MTSRLLLLCIISIGLLNFIGCKDPFEPKVEFRNTSFLVVEGYLNSEGPTTIRLSRTVPLNNSNAINPELNAQVRVESSNGSSFSLSANGDGTYTIASMALRANEQYRLYIKTSNNKEYVSDYVSHKVTPVIDELILEKKPSGIQVLVSTHDAQNQTRYYRWDFEETWEFNSIDKSFYEWSESQQTLINRTNIEALYTCWRTEPSSRINLSSSAKLEEDIIFRQPITFIPDTSWKLSVRYSILVKQYALTKKAFEYWQQMAQNTEQLGSIFDAQPSELQGNLKCLSNPKEPVIGYMSAGTIEGRRIFISKQEIPDFIYRNNCSIDTVGKDPLRSYFSSGLSIPLSYRTNPRGESKLVYASRECVDCRTRGTNVKPSFW